jgi:hypothetical protein
MTTFSAKRWLKATSSSPKPTMRPLENQRNQDSSFKSPDQEPWSITVQLLLYQLSA